MAEARQRTTFHFVSGLVMVGLAVAGCMSVPQRPRTGGHGGTGGEDPEGQGETEADASAPGKKLDAKVEATTTLPPDAAVTVDVGGSPSPDAKAGGAEVSAMAPDGGAAAVTFTELWTSIFGTPAMQASSCAGAACHNPGVKDMVNFSSKEMAYASLTRARGPVVKGNPTMSKIMTRLTSTSAAQRMPLGKPALSKDLIEKVRAWIAAGANND
jgi:hypothetical protein